MCRGCKLKSHSVEYYLDTLVPLANLLQRALEKYETELLKVPELDNHHKKIVKLRKLINNELNTYQPKDTE